MKRINILKCMYQSYIMGLNDSNEFFKSTENKLPTSEDVILSLTKIYDNIVIKETEENK